MPDGEQQPANKHDAVPHDFKYVKWREVVWSWEVFLVISFVIAFIKMISILGLGPGQWYPILLAISFFTCRGLYVYKWPESLGNPEHGNVVNTWYLPCAWYTHESDGGFERVLLGHGYLSLGTLFACVNLLNNDQAELNGLTDQQRSLWKDGFPQFNRGRDVTWSCSDLAGALLSMLGLSALFWYMDSSHPANGCKEPGEYEKYATVKHMRVQVWYARSFKVACLLQIIVLAEWMRFDFTFDPSARHHLLRKELCVKPDPHAECAFWIKKRGSSEKTCFDDTLFQPQENIKDLCRLSSEPNPDVTAWWSYTVTKLTKRDDERPSSRYVNDTNFDGGQRVIQDSVTLWRENVNYAFTKLYWAMSLVPCVLSAVKINLAHTNQYTADGTFSSNMGCIWLCVLCQFALVLYVHVPWKEIFGAFLSCTRAMVGMAVFVLFIVLGDQYDTNGRFGRALHRAVLFSKIVIGYVAVQWLLTMKLEKISTPIADAHFSKGG